MAKAKEPFTGYRDKDKILVRRDIVTRLHAQGMRPHQILKVLQAAKETAGLIAGYKNKYQIIRNDIAKGPKPLHHVSEGVQAAALAQYVHGLEAQKSSIWEALNKGVSVFAGDDAGEIVRPLDPIERLKYFEQLHEVEKSLARARGVSTEETALVKDDTPQGGVTNNYTAIGGSPEALLAAAATVRELSENAKLPARTVIDAD